MRTRGDGAGNTGSYRWIVPIGRRYAQSSRKRLQWDVDVGGERSVHFLEIQIQIFDLTLRKIRGQQSCSQRSGVIEHRAPVERLDAFVADFQHVSRLGIIYGNRPNDGVRTASGIVLS